MYDMYPSYAKDRPKDHQFNGGLGHVGYEGLFDDTATAAEVAAENTHRRQLEQREKLSPLVAEAAMYGSTEEGND